MYNPGARGYVFARRPIGARAWVILLIKHNLVYYHFIIWSIHRALVRHYKSRIYLPETIYIFQSCITQAREDMYSPGDQSARSICMRRDIIGAQYRYAPGHHRRAAHVCCWIPPATMFAIIPRFRKIIFDKIEFSRDKVISHARNVEFDYCGETCRTL